MDILPEDFAEFRSKSYWDNFFQKRKSVPFEWYGEWSELKGLIGTECRATEEFLVIGCGNSELSAHMYDAGYAKITNVDFSRLVILEMLKKHVRARPRMRWLVMDMTNMTFADGSYDVVVDKGGLDALMGEPGEAGTAAGINLLTEVERVLRPEGGRYFCVTLAQEHVIGLVMERFRSGWQLSLHRVPQPAGSAPSALRPFLLVATRRAAPEQSGLGLPLVTLTFEQRATEGMDPEQMEALLAAVKRENEARRGGLPASCPAADLRRLSPGRREERQLARGDLGRGWRYTAVILDVAEDAGKPALECAVFLVPQGREHEWLFAAEEGQRQLLHSTGAARLILVSLNRGHHFGSSADVQAELSPLVLPLAPEGCRDGRVQIPFMTTGDGIGKRVVLEEWESPLTGPVLVEDVDLRGAADPPARPLLRRLIFRRSPTLIQSEAALREPSTSGRSLASPIGQQENGEAAPASGSAAGKKKKKKGSKGGGGKSTESGGEVAAANGKSSSEAGREDSSGATAGLGEVDHGYLASEYHVAMLAGLALIAPQLATWQNAKAPVRAMVVGLGGGALPMFLRTHLPLMHVQVVELDAVVGEVARRHFGFADDARLQLDIGDGIAAVLAIARAAEPFQVASREGTPSEQPRKGQGAAPESETREEDECERGQPGEGPTGLVPGGGALEVRRMEAQEDAAALGRLNLEGRPIGNGQVAGGKNSGADPRLHLLIVDADSDDPLRVGMTCPPAAFLDAPFLPAARAALHEDGMLVVNVVARSTAPYAAAKAALQQNFEEVYEVDVDEDVNRVLFALPRRSSATSMPGGPTAAAVSILAMVRREDPWSQRDALTKYAESLQLAPAGI